MARKNKAEQATTEGTDVALATAPSEIGPIEPVREDVAVTGNGDAVYVPGGMPGTHNGEPRPPAPRRQRTRRPVDPDRAYWVCAQEARGEPLDFILQRPTIGQARKNVGLCRTMPMLRGRRLVIARVVIVE